MQDKIDENTSDGYHTFKELYEHRIILWQLLISSLYGRLEKVNGEKQIWKSKLHSDGTMFDGWFVSGLFTEKGEQITYHLPSREWELTAGVELEKAPTWDGHTSKDVVKRLRYLLDQTY